jgi:Ca2+-binding RTX toxin-like protein
MRIGRRLRPSPAMAVAFAALFVALAGTALSQGTPPPGTPPATCNGLAATLVGTEGSDDLRGGTPGPDVIVGLGGGDILGRTAGDDVICGGDGRDELSGGRGNDTLLGEAGKDALGDRHGNDTLLGGPGGDLLTAGPGNDTLLGEAGKDALFGEAGKDLCVGGPGKDIDRVAHRHQGRADRPDSFFMPVPWKCEVKKSI